MNLTAVLPVVFALLQITAAVSVHVQKRSGEYSEDSEDSEYSVDALGQLYSDDDSDAYKIQNRVCYVSTRNCKQLRECGASYSGCYTVQPSDGGPPLTAYCDMTLLNGEGWTVIQRRFDDSVNFTKTYSDYEYGFGRYDGNFWLGLRNIRRMTLSEETFELYVGLQKHDGSQACVLYDYFDIEDRALDYKLTVGSISTRSGLCETNGQDSLDLQSGAGFSTFDHDCDGQSGTNCAADNHGGWWFSGTNCLESNLHGKYYAEASSSSKHDGIVWESWSADSLQATIMAIRPKD